MATELERLTVQLEAQTAKFEKALARAEGRSAATAKKVERTFAQMQGNIGRSFSGVGGQALGVLGVGLGVREVIQYADAWTKATNSLKVAGLSGAAVKDILDALYGAAQRQGVPLEALTTLYGRAAQAQKELGASSSELIQFSEDVAMALRVAGTSPDEATGALLQLSQLLGSARVQAEEFNSINEGARPILQAVAAGIEEAGGSVSRLKQLVNDGEISNVAFFKGFQAGVQTIRDAAANAEPTISQAFTRVQNAVTRLIGEIDAANGFSKSFVAELSSMADGFKELQPAIQFVIDALKMLADLQDYVNKNGLNLGTKFNQAIFGANTVSDFINGAPSGRILVPIGPAAPFGSGGIGSDPDRNLAPPTKPIKAADYPVAGGASKKGGSGSSDYARETQQIRDRTAALELEASTVGRSTFEVEKARVAQELLNAAKADGKAITPELTAQINAEAEAYARAAEKVDKARESYRMVEDVQDGLASSLSAGISAMRKSGDAIDAVTDSLGRMLDQLLDMISKQLFKQLFEGFGITGFGFSAGGSVGGGAVKAATGGRVVGPGTGTSDSIPAWVSNDEFIVRAAPARRYRKLLEAINSGGLHVPHFATGGAVGGLPARAGGFGGGTSVQVVNNTGVEAGARAETTRGPNGQAVLRIFLDAARKDFASGGYDTPARGRYSLMPAPVRKG
ncbi:tape measure protein [Xanthobacter autotrophicus DSM 597]|uniref:tape measure protein n=1 Tax=Xanthobacter wiegelii TaxID=3119913 RepID=UPI00372B0D43